MKTEDLKEGWVKFTRWHCKKGHLDRWVGDCINDPNLPSEHNMCLNSIAFYWRCNDGNWIHDKEMRGCNIHSLLEYREFFTSKEIWDELLRLSK